MTLSMIIVLGLLVLNLTLFSIERFSVDLVTLSLLIVLVLTGTLTPGEAFSGFGSEFVVMLASLFVVGEAFQETRFLERLCGRLTTAAKYGPKTLLALIMTVTGGISSFMNNTTATAMLAPAVTGLVRRIDQSPSKFLMPVAFASMLGGICTLIGTSTNVAVSGYLSKAGLQPIGLFETTPLGLLLLAVGILYMISFGFHLLPNRPPSLEEAADLRQYVCEVRVLPDSPIVGQRVFASDFSTLRFRAIQIRRSDGPAFRPTAGDVFQAGDLVCVSGDVEKLERICRIEGLRLTESSGEASMLTSSSVLCLFEFLVTPHSDLAGRRIRDSSFRQRHGMEILAIHHEGRSASPASHQSRLQVGDVILVAGPEHKADLLEQSRDASILREPSQPNSHLQAGWRFAIIFVGAVILGSTGVMPISIAFLTAAVGVVLTRCLTLERAYQSIDWRLIILIGGMTAFGVAMEKTGTSTFLGEAIAGGLSPWGPRAVLAGFFILTILLTQPMSNAAAALVVLPVALSAAQEIGIMLAASISFIAPFEPSCMLVYNAGNYRFRDFVTAGFGLTVVLSFITLWLAPHFWPL